MPDENWGLSDPQWAEFWQDKVKPEGIEPFIQQCIEEHRQRHQHHGTEHRMTDWYEARLEEMAREVVIEEFDGGNVVVNNHGIEVLQTSELAIADIDTSDKETAIRRAVWVLSRDEVSARLYETCAGVRILLIGKARPTSEGMCWLQALRSDRRYRKLCQRSRTYRARLEPKPQRVQAGGRYQVCRFMTAVGETNQFEPLVNLHDRRCHPFGSQRLA